MKPPSILTLSGLASLAFAPSLMADKPAADPEHREASPVPAPRIAICKSAPESRPSLRELKSMEANDESIQSILRSDEAETTIAKLNAPIVLNSMEEALKHLNRDSMERIADEVDFKTEKVVVFAWRGSGEDRLRGFMNEGATFHYTPGMTEDLETHSAIYAMPADAAIEAVEVRRHIIRCGVGELERGRIQLKLDNKEQEMKIVPIPAPVPEAE